MGYTCGAVVTLSILFEYTKELDPKISWSIIGGMCILFAFITLCMVKEPPDAKKASCAEFCKKLCKSFRVIKGNHEIMLGFLNWVISFQDI
jgi:hypothetical protein